MENKNIELELVKKILELKNGEYIVNTSKGKYIVRKTKEMGKDKFDNTKKIEKKGYMLITITDVKKLNENITNISIKRSDKTIFGEYNLKEIYLNNHKCNGLYTESLIFYPKSTNFKYGFKINVDNEMIIYDDNEKTKYYKIFNNKIYYNDNDNNNDIKYYQIENNILYKYEDSKFLLGIDLNNFDRIISINNKNIRIPKDKNIKEELDKIKNKFENIKNLVNNEINNDKYVKEILDISNNFNFKLITKNIKPEDFKNIEREMLNIYKMYLEAKKIMSYKCDISILREITEEIEKILYEQIKEEEKRIKKKKN